MEEEEVHNAKEDTVTPQLTTKCKVAALSTNFSVQMLNSSSMAAAMGICQQLEIDNKIRKRKERYLCSGVLHTPCKSFCTQVLKIGEEMEFFHFLSMSWSAFNDLVELLTPYIINNPLNHYHQNACERTSKKRKYKPCDIIATEIRYLLITVELKDIQAQFGAVLSCPECIELGMCKILTLIDCPKCRVPWERSVDYCKEISKRTETFLDIEGVVGMLNDRKVVSLNPSIRAEQNRDYNGWTSDVNSNLVLFWDPYGKIIDAAVNTPGNYHDSKSSIRCDIYKHIEKLPAGFKVVCDSTFPTKGNLQGNIV